MRYEIIKQKGNTIISVKRLSDGVIFSVGDTIHIKRYYDHKAKHKSVAVDVEIQISSISNYPDTNGEEVWLNCGKYSTGLYDEANMGHVKQLSQDFLEQEEKARAEFAEKLQELLPDVERMIETEQNHLNYLHRCKNKYDRYISWNDIEPMIKRSEQMLSHLKERLEQYEKYVEKYLVKA